MDLLRLLRTGDVRGRFGPLRLTVQEMAFRLFCRHKQGGRPNVLLFCLRRGGSTWLLNTLSMDPTTRYVGRPFMIAPYTRWRNELPNLAEAAGYDGDDLFEHFVHFEGEAARRFEQFARDVVVGQRPVYPMIRFWEPYFHRVTDRIIFQVTNATALIEWFAQNTPCTTMLLLRHPISNAMSIMRKGWRLEHDDFLNHRWFVETHLDGKQVDLARQIARDGSPLQRHVLDWTLKMLVPIRAFASGKHPDWLVATYEQMVLQNREMVQRIADRLDCRNIEGMLEQVSRPSRTVTSSTAGRVDDPEYLVGRWKKKVGDDEEDRVLRIPREFGIDAYQPGSLTATDTYLHTFDA